MGHSAGLAHPQAAGSKKPQRPTGGWEAIFNGIRP
jgi:hypothetical protein